MLSFGSIDQPSCVHQELAVDAGAAFGYFISDIQQTVADAAPIYFQTITVSSPP
jgi:hypothetical protein